MNSKVSPHGLQTIRGPRPNKKSAILLFVVLKSVPGNSFDRFPRGEYH